MENKYTSIKFKAKVKPIEKLNDEFTLCKCYVQGIGKNRNLSYMSKENVVKNSSTLHYAPVVGHLIKKEDGSAYMGGHDWTIDDDCNFKSICVPYGVVTKDDFEFEMVDEYGVQVEYMTANVILWTGRYPELMESVYSEDVFFNQSMEINVEQYRPYEEDSNYTELLDWTYSALCMLGKADDKDSLEHTEPCFIESKIIPIQYDFEKAEFADVMSEMKKELAFYFKKEGDDVKMTKLEELCAIYEVKVDDIDWEYENMTNEELEVAFEEHYGCKKKKKCDCEEPTSGEEHSSIEEEPPNASISIEEEKPVEEDTNAENYVLKTEYDEYKESHKYSNKDYTDLESKYNELKSFKDSYDAAQTKAQKDEILNSETYAILADNEAFKALISDAEKFSVDEIATKAKAIFADHIIATGTFSAKPIDSKKSKIVTMNLQQNDRMRDCYGGLFLAYKEKYGK